MIPYAIHAFHVQHGETTNGRSGRKRASPQLLHFRNNVRKKGGSTSWTEGITRGRWNPSKNEHCLWAGGVSHAMPSLSAAFRQKVWRVFPKGTESFPSELTVQRGLDDGKSVSENTVKIFPVIQRMSSRYRNVIEQDIKHLGGRGPLSDQKRCISGPSCPTAVL